ncbi:uncharacterized protein LOC8286680 [Ricinus communis]|uniref:Uncharacterized protein n=1 Tax=Ricinus communis TaxID=3988 RepID=B9RDX5_RICCO|nr:uncharacterized protein LOC8286680 [Ricinus communis]EEF50583.1 hypothetical protein RCOM_1616500 [Ricinus communis]|eukprot:XP_002511914.1 uncharacterized protein LOC8286680 [Ricinus communis]
MNLENEEQQHVLNQDAEAAGNESQKKSIISYTREFLLSLSELDICKKLPSGFDQSILSEFEDAPQDRFRSSGALASQNYRRNDYGSSPPTRGDVSNYSKGNHGRWDSRSSGKSDRDSDTQSDWDSDSGRRYGNQSRRPWQVPEHDGLLGSGSFPRPSGYAAGASAPKSRANDQYQLNRSNEPYHPPRPYKAVPHSRRDTDSYNDETFGSSECTSEDRAEEERKRRASFELMRKEQQKTFQEKQKLNPEKGKGAFDISELLEDQKDDKRFLDRRNESIEPATKPASSNGSDKSSFPSPAPVSRPLVPPGFSSTIVEKNIGVKSISHPQPSEVGNELDHSILHAKGNRLFSGTSNNQEDKQSLEPMDSTDQQLGSRSIHVSVSKRNEKVPTLSSSLDVSSEAVGMDSQYYSTSKFSETLEASENNEVIELDLKSMTGHKLVGGSSPTRSTSILDKLFGSALTLNGVGSSNIVEQHNEKEDDIQDPHLAQSSRFAQWFLEEEKKPIGDLSSGRPNKSVEGLSSSRPNDLLSLIVGAEKSGLSFVSGDENSGSQGFDVEATENTPSSFPHQGSGLADGLMTSNLAPVTVENIDKLEAAPAVLTCEDLEQSILSEITESGPMSQPPVQGWSGDSGAKMEQQKVDIDNHASQQLLSLLQKGTDLGIISADKLQSVEVENHDVALHSSGEIAAENITNAGGPLTLETLFGTAFMKELQSVRKPAPGQRDSVGSVRVDVSESLFPMMDKDFLASTPDITSSMPNHGNSLLASNQRQHMKLERMEETFSGFDPQNVVNSSQLRTELGTKLGGVDGFVGIGLPEEDSLITANDPLNLQNFMPARNSPRTELLTTPETAVDIAGKLAALNSVYRDERPIIGGQEGPGFLRGTYDAREPDVQYHKTHAQPSSPLHPQLNHQGTMFHPLDSHPASVNAQMKFMSPENIIHHDPPNHQFPANLLRPPFHHPNTGLTGLDPSPHNPVLQQMQSPGNFPPPHLLRGFPRGGPLTSHPINQVTGFIQEVNPMQGFPFSQRQPNLGGFGIPPQAPDAGGGTRPPEALQRLFEMELRSKSKPTHPFASAGHSQGMYGHELDTGFGYR